MVRYDIFMFTRLKWRSIYSHSPRRRRLIVLRACDSDSADIPLTRRNWTRLERTCRSWHRPRLIDSDSVQSECHSRLTMTTSSHWHWWWWCCCCWETYSCTLSSKHTDQSMNTWIKYGALWAHCWGLALADFGRNLRSSESLRGSRNIVFCQVNNARFHRLPVGQILRHLNAKTSIGVAMKTFGTEFWTFYHKGSFFQKTQKLLTNFPGLATSGRRNTAMITDRWKFTTKLTLYGMSIVNYEVSSTRATSVSLHSVHRAEVYLDGVPSVV